MVSHVYQGNHADGSGGALYAASGGSATSGAVSFKGSGGAIYSGGSVDSSMEKTAMTTFQSNTSYLNGGAIYAVKTITLTDSSFSFLNNSSTIGFGGALSAGEITIMLGYYNFTGNSCSRACDSCQIGPSLLYVVSSAGGAIYSDGSITLSPSNIVLYDNSTGVNRPEVTNCPKMVALMGGHIAGKHINWPKDITHDSVKISKKKCDDTNPDRWSIGELGSCTHATIDSPSFTHKCPVYSNI